MRSSSELAGVLAHEIAHVQAGHYERISRSASLGTIPAIAAIILSGGNPAVFAGALALLESYQLAFSRRDGGGGRPPLDDLSAPDLVRPAGPARRDAADRGRGAFHAVQCARIVAHPPAHPVADRRPRERPRACPPAKSIGPVPTPAGTGSARSCSPSTSRRGRCASSASGPARVTRSTSTCSGSSMRAAATRPRPPCNFAGPSPRRPGRPATRSISAWRSGRSGTPPARAPRSSGPCSSRADRPIRTRTSYSARSPRSEGRDAEALERYARATELGPPLAEAHYQFALALSGTARLGEADFHFARAAGLRGDYIGALASYRRARGLLGADPDWAARIDAALAHME